MSDQAVASFYMEGDSLELLWHNTDSLPEHGDLFLTSGTSQQLEAFTIAALKEENERLEREAINAFQMFTSADARLSVQINENAVLKALVAELEHTLKTLVEHNK